MMKKQTESIRPPSEMTKLFVRTLIARCEWKALGRAVSVFGYDALPTGPLQDILPDEVAWKEFQKGMEDND